MKATKLFSILLTSLLVSTVYPLSSFAQDSTHFSLSEDTTPESQKASIAAIQYSRDGRLLAIASPSGIWLYDTESGEEVPLLKRRIDGISNASLSPDGKTLAGGSTGRGKGAIRLFDVQTGANTRTFRGHTTFVWSVALNPDGKTLAPDFITHFKTHLRFFFQCDIVLK